MGKGQSSVEYLGVTIAALAVFSPIAIYAFTALQDNTAAAAASQAQSSVEQLQDAADTVCGSPTGTQHRLTVSVPPQVDTANSGFGTLHKQTIHFSLRTGDRSENVTGVVSCNVTGLFPDRTGPVTFTLTKKGSNFVNITAQ
jgi:hypothetical protein